MTLPFAQPYFLARCLCISLLAINVASARGEQARAEKSPTPLQRLINRVPNDHTAIVGMDVKRFRDSKAFVNYFGVGVYGAISEDFGDLTETLFDSADAVVLSFPPMKRPSGDVDLTGMIVLLRGDFDKALITSMLDDDADERTTVNDTTVFFSTMKPFTNSIYLVLAGIRFPETKVCLAFVSDDVLAMGFGDVEVIKGLLEMEHGPSKDVNAQQSRSFLKRAAQHSIFVASATGDSFLDQSGRVAPSMNDVRFFGVECDFTADIRLDLEMHCKTLETAIETESGLKKMGAIIWNFLRPFISVGESGRCLVELREQTRISTDNRIVHVKASLLAPWLDVYLQDLHVAYLRTDGSEVKSRKDASLIKLTYADPETVKFAACGRDEHLEKEMDAVFVFVNMKGKLTNCEHLGGACFVVTRVSYPLGPHDTATTRVLSKRFSDSEGKAVAGPAGFARMEREFDEDLVHVNSQYFGPDDHALKSRCIVVAVEEGSVATMVGMQSGDELVQYNGKDIESMAHFLSIRRKVEGVKMPLVFKRDGKSIRVNVGKEKLGIRLDDVIETS